MLFLAGTMVMALLLALARVYDAFPGDEWALLELRQWRVDWLNAAITTMYVVWLGGLFGLPYVPIGIVIFAGLRNRRDGVFLAACGVLPLALNLRLKEVAARPRPDEALALVEGTGYGFPSSHAVFAIAFYGALLYLLGRWDVFPVRPWFRRLGQGALALLVLAVGASRVYVGVHWPSDVIGGFLFGGLCLAALAMARQWVQDRH